MSTTPSVSTWKTEFDERVTAFAKSTKIDEAIVREVLDDLGVDREDADCLTMLDNEDVLQTGILINEFVEKRKVVKIARLRLGLNHLRGRVARDEVAAATNGDECSESDLGNVCGAIKDMVASNRPKSDWSDKELLEAYNEDTTEIAEVLRKRSKGRHCIVFKKDGTTNVEVSLGLLRTAKRQPTSDQHRVDGRSVRVYRPGDVLAKTVDESPFVPGTALVSDYCSKSDTDWSGVSYSRRLMVRLHVMKVETAKLSTREMQRICKDARDMSDSDFDDGYSKAAMIYAELEEQDKLPKLKILPSESHDSCCTTIRDTGFC